mmetsp:Transcript_1087/g.2794  ORF Transcript_1087/g.2794 Transcript_1087/m.2794 type:complete len:324 (-) Transcript_1087:510-1481(-)
MVNIIHNEVELFTRQMHGIRQRVGAFRCRLVFQCSALLHFFLGETDQFFAQLPHLLGCFGIFDSVRLLVLENFTTGTSCPTRFAIFSPASDGLGTSVPTPVDTGLVALRIVDNLGKSFSGFRLADVSPGDVFHEGREKLSEPFSLFSEERSLGNASRVHAGKDDSGVLVVSSVKFGYGHHVANLGVLVGLGSKEWFSVNHGNWLHSSLLETFQLSKISSGVNKTSTNGVGVSSDRSDNADTSSLSTTHVVQQQVNQQKVTKMVDTHGHLESIVSPCWFGVSWSVNSSVTDQVGEGSCALESLEVGDKVTNGLKAGKFQLHASV